MIRVEITDKRKQAFCKWLVSRGAELLAPSTAYEIARFRCEDGVSVVAATAKGDLYFSGNGYHIWDCYLKGSAWRAFPKGKREDKKGRSRLMATVALRDGENCFYCHKPLYEDRSLEHLLSITFGGSNHLANLVLAHRECNEAAGNKSVREKLQIHIDNMKEDNGGYLNFRSKDGMVSGFFGGQTAAYDSDLSLIAEGYPDTDRHISNHVAKLGEMTTFGWYEAGTELTFKLFVHDTGDTFYSNTAMNPDGMEHARAFQFALPNGSLSVFTPVIFMGFEDLMGGGDMDFNDNMAMFSNVIMVPVPEPSSIAMLLAGLGLLGFTRKTFLS